MKGTNYNYISSLHSSDITLPGSPLSLQGRYRTPSEIFKIENRLLTSIDFQTNSPARHYSARDLILFSCEVEDARALPKILQPFLQVIMPKRRSDEELIKRYKNKIKKLEHKKQERRRRVIVYSESDSDHESNEGKSK